MKSCAGAIIEAPAPPPCPSAPGPDQSVPIQITPNVNAWPSLLNNSPLSTDARRFRAELGLPLDQPIVMTGHQASLWHPGVLAKFIAAQAFADASGAQAAWIIPDQDLLDTDDFRSPALDASNRLNRAHLLAENIRTPAPSCVTPTILAEPGLPRTSEHTMPSVQLGVARIINALKSHEKAPHAAAQLIGALGNLTHGFLDPAPTIFASQLWQTEAFISIAHKLADDADRAIAFYNRAALAEPGAGVRTLAHFHSLLGPELPLWRITPSGKRFPVYANEIHDIPPAQLAPRALFMTGLLRMLGCDLFIHGTGGGVYDRITEQWFKDWLGVELAPTVVVSATLRLPLDEHAAPLADAQRAAWLSHSAKHNPDPKRDPIAAQQKAAHLQQISRLRAEGKPTDAAFRTMHAALAEYRDRRAPNLQILRENASEMIERHHAQSIAAARDWPFPLYDPKKIAALAISITRAFV